MSAQRLVDDVEGRLTALRGDALADEADLALSQEQLQVALRLYDQAEAEARDPDRCAGGRWMAHMLSGDFASAWRESDAIRRRGAPDPHRFWQGEPLEGCRLMLRSLHGFGDAVQMFRFLPQLRERVRSLVVEVPPRLVELAPAFQGMGQVITWGRDAPGKAPAWDVQMEVMELPYALRVSVADLAPQQGYLQLRPERRAAVAQIMGPRHRPRVGLVWEAGEWNRTRSVPFGEFKRLLAPVGVEFWSLQGDGDRGSWQQFAGQPGRRDVKECGDGIATLAAVIAKMDLVITVDTLAAHLAGCLGVPCWVLLQQRADWRWMVTREDTPWYPSLRLWRQQVAGDWMELLGRVGAALSLWADAQAYRGVM